MGISDKKIEYGECLRSEDISSVLRSRDWFDESDTKGKKDKRCPVAHLPPMWGREWLVQPKLLQKFYDRTIATGGWSV
jgi:hypothetical protein